VQNRPFIIGLDVDGVVADLVGALLRALHDRTGQLLIPEQIHSFDLRTMLGDSMDIASDILSEKGFVRDIQPYPNAIDGIEQLRRIGRVVFVTTPFHPSPTWSHERTAWLVKHTRARRRDIVLLDDKTLFCGSLLIDDAPHQLEAWTRDGRAAIRVVRPWNDGAAGLAARSWGEIVALAEVVVRSFRDERV
jgi:5'(3')-deoxyribonucleotidase